MAIVGPRSFLTCLKYCNHYFYGHKALCKQLSMCEWGRFGSVGLLSKTLHVYYGPGNVLHGNVLRAVCVGMCVVVNVHTHTHIHTHTHTHTQAGVFIMIICTYPLWNATNL